MVKKDVSAHHQSDLWVVDDDPFALNLMTTVLRSQGYKVQAFDNPEAAIEAARTRSPSLMLLDIAMPTMTGLAACQQLKQDEQIDDFPVIFVSGQEELVDRIQGFQVGGVDYLIKPVQREELLARINTHLSLYRMQKHLEEVVDERTLELKQKSRTLEQANSELKATLARLEEAQSRLLQSEKLAAIGQLAAGVVHEMNNPIGYVYSNLGTLDDYVGDMVRLLKRYEHCTDHLAPEQAQAITTIRRQIGIDDLIQDLPDLIAETTEGASRAKQIITDLKDFSRMDQGEWKRADLHKGLDSTLNIIHNELKYKAEVRKEYGDIPRVDCISSQLNQVFMNFLVNAAHAIEERGMITIRTGVEGQEVWVEVEDTGKGILPENLDKIFDPFFTTKPEGIGTGLGLPISLGIVNRHGGRIDTNSEVGKGTRFRIWLPIQRNDAQGRSE